MNNKIDLNNLSKVTTNNVNPVIIYTNADLDKPRIIEDNRNKVGIYLPSGSELTI